MRKRWLYLLIVLSVDLHGVTHAQVCDLSVIPPNLRTSLRAYYPFCGNYQDISGNGYNGSSVGNVPFIPDRYGINNSAIQGGGGYVPTSNQFFQFKRSDTFTVSVWFTVPAAGCGGRLLSTESGEGHFRIAYYGNGAVAVQFGDYIIDTVTVNAWHHLVYVYANRNERVYMDGELKRTNYETEINETLVYQTPFTIGAKASPANDLWCGNIDDVGVWGRALNDCEVKQLYLMPYGFTTPIYLDYFPLPPLLNACADSVTLNAFRTGCTYRWNTGETTPTITPRFNGEYQVITTDQFGCVAYDSIYVNLSTASLKQLDTSICSGDSLVLELAEGINDPVLYDFNSCLFADFENTNGGGAASATVNGLQSCGLNLEWPAAVESIRKRFSYGLYEIDMKPSLTNSAQYFTVLGVNIESRPIGTDNAGYLINVNGVPVKTSPVHPAQFPNWYHLRVNITADSLTVWIDNTQIYADKHADFGPAPLSPITVGTFSSSFFDNIRYTPFGPRQTILWSTGDTTRSIVVRPTTSTLYTVRVNDWLNCTDSVLVTVSDRVAFDPLPDTVRFCGRSINLDAGPGFATYNWSNGLTTQHITADSTGYYRIHTTDDKGCMYSDTGIISLLVADITQSDTSICAGNAITLSIDSIFPGVLVNQPPSIPPSLYTFMQAYYPFSGNTNDYSKNNYTGYGSNVTLTTDRFGNPNSAYQFNGVDSRIFIPYQFFNNGWQDYTISLWFSPDSHAGTTGPGQTLLGTLPRYATAIGYSYNDSRRVYHFKNSNTANVGWDILNNDALNAGPLELGKWYHLIVVKRGLNYEYYLNGRLDKRVATTTPPLNENCTLQLGAMMSDNSDAFRGKLDEVMVFDRALDTLQLQQLDVYTPRVRWSTGDTTKSITVSPDSTALYHVTVTNGVSSCTDSIRVGVVTIEEYDPLPDTLSVCGDSVILDAGAGYEGYKWSTGDTVSSISVFGSGYYKVEVFLASGCKAADSGFISLLKADILSIDTSICKGTSVLLSIDSSTLSRQSNIRIDLPPALRDNLIAHFPFNGNANEVLGNNGIPYNVLPTSDRNGLVDSAYSFNGINSSIVPSFTNTSMVNSFTYAFWANPQANIIVPQQSQTGGAASNMFTNPCVLHPIHGVTFGGNQNQNAGSGIYLGVNGLYLEEHSDGWEAVPLSYSSDLRGWHHYTIVYESKVPGLFIDGKFIKSGIPSNRNIYASLGKDNYPAYTRSGIGAGYSPPWNSTAQYYRGDLDELMYFNRSLTQAEINIFLTPTVIWSTGDTTPSITVTPDTTTTYYVTVSNGITSCTDSVKVTVSAIRDFNPFPDSLCVCADSIVLDAGTGYSSYDWNTGDTTQRITVFRKGWHKVIVTNESGCRAEDSVYIRRVFADILQNDTSLRALTPYELSIDTSYFTENGYKVYWSTGDSTTSITVVPRQKTKYYVRVTDGVVTCTDSITIDVKRIGGFNPCPPKVAKCDRRVVLDAGPGYLSYLWSTGDTTQQITVTSNGYYTVYVFDSSGAFGEDSTYVNLLALTLQPRDTTICRGSSVQLTAGNFFNGNDLILPTFAWATGEQDTALNVSPGETTTYYAKLTNANNSCRDSAIVRVVAVDASLSIVGDSVLCANSNDSIVLRAGRGRSYQWLNNGGAIAGANDSLYVTRQAGNYSVVVTDTLGCQDSSRVQSVVVSPLPVGTFLPPASNSFCIGDSVLLAATGANSYRWYLNGSPINGATAARYYAKQAGTYSVVFVSDKGCIVPGDTIVLRASKKPKASFTYTTYCAGISSQFSSTSDTLNAGDLQYLWKFADGSTAGGPAISHVFARSGNYPVQLILTSFDCPNYADTATVNVNVQAPAAGIRYRTLNLTINVSVTLVARPLGNDFLWTPSNGLDDPRARTPRLMPKENATYLIRISNTAGCVTTDTLGVQVFDGRDLFVARGFTPNNDGKNDRLYPIAIGIVELRYFRIYNRWGNLVFQSSSLLPQDGWDGTYSGKAQTSDTYTWMAEGVDIEGKVIRRSGSSILIR